MKKIILSAAILLGTHAVILAQNFEWKAGLNYFFDNTEYARSTLTNDQTMTGVRFSPEVGLAWDSVHHIFTGVDLLKTSGSTNFIDRAFPIAYYQYTTTKTHFLAGAFPRSELLTNYSDLFFQDSVGYYRPTLQGFFWQRGNTAGFFNMWLDWTGHQTATDRETFFIGISGHKKAGHFFADFQSYMFHFANTLPSTPTYNLCDNLLAHLSVGVDYSNQSGLDTLLFAVGLLSGYERERGSPEHTPQGLVVRGNVEYAGFGIQNTLYYGNPRQFLYSKYGNNLYWNNPFLRSGFYLQSKWYLDVIRNPYVHGRLNLNLHFTQGKILYEQVFTVSAALSNTGPHAGRYRQTILNKIFKP